MVDRSNSIDMTVNQDHFLTSSSPKSQKRYQSTQLVLVLRSLTEISASEWDFICGVQSLAVTFLFQQTASLLLRIISRPKTFSELHSAKEIAPIKRGCSEVFKHQPSHNDGEIWMYSKCCNVMSKHGGWHAHANPVSTDAGQEQPPKLKESPSAH